MQQEVCQTARTKCGKWIVDYTKAIPKLDDLAARADLACEDLAEADFVQVASQSCHRPCRFRFVDNPEIKQLIHQRKHSTDPLEKRHLGREIVHKRAESKKSWRTELLDRAASGDYQVISYFRRKQALSASQLEYCLRVGGAVCRGSTASLVIETRKCVCNVLSCRLTANNGLAAADSHLHLLVTKEFSS